MVGARPVWDVEAVLRMRARRSGVGPMVSAERVLNDAAVNVVPSLHSVFRIDQEPLTAHGAANIRRQLGRLT